MMASAKLHSFKSLTPHMSSSGNVKLWTSHGAQNLLQQGASLPQIMVKGGWVKTDTVMLYIGKVKLSSLSSESFYLPRT